MKPVSVQFPLRGLDVASPYDNQPDGTSPDAVNVRSFDPFLRRMRGGSRPGLSRYINGDIGSEIQDINSVVLPSATALGISFDDVAILDVTFQLEDLGGLVLADGSVNWIYVNGSGFYTHPSYSRVNSTPSITSLIPDSGDFVGGDVVTVTGENLGDGDATFKFGTEDATLLANDGTTATVVVPGISDPGSNVTVNVTVTTGLGTSAATSANEYTYTEIEFVQFVGDDISGGGDLAFSSNVTSGNAIFVILTSSELEDFDLTDSLGTTYSRLGTAYEDTASVFHSLYYGRALSTGANTVTLTTDIDDVQAGVYEMFGVASSPFESQSSGGNADDDHGGDYDFGTITISGKGRLILASYFHPSTYANPDFGGTNRDVDSFVLHTIDIYGKDQTYTEIVGVSAEPDTHEYHGVGWAIKPGV